MNIFASVLTYELAKAMGIEAAQHEFRRQVDNPKSVESLPAARMVARLREIGNVMLCHPAGTSLPKVRSRTAHEAHKWLRDNGGGIWVMCDDDVECDLPTLNRMIAAAGESRVSVLPCPIRGTAAERSTINVLWDGSLVLEEHTATAGNLLVRLVRRGGCGMMIVPFEALHLVLEASREDREIGDWLDDDGQIKVALFQQMICRELGANPPGGRWLGEDYSFCERLRAAGIPIVAPVEGMVVHDGQLLDLKLCQG